MDIQAALEPRLTRDAVDERQKFRVLEATYSPGKEHVPRFLGISKPWDDEVYPQVVTARVLAVPHEVLPRGVDVRSLLRELLAEAFLKLTSKGLPVDRSRRNAWLLEVVLDARVALLEAALSPWNGGEHKVSERLQRRLNSTE